MFKAMIVKQEAAIDSYFTMRKHRGSEVRKYVTVNEGSIGKYLYVHSHFKGNQHRGEKGNRVSGAT